MFYEMHFVASHVFSASRIIIRINKYIYLSGRIQNEHIGILGSISQLLMVNIDINVQKILTLSIKTFRESGEKKEIINYMCIS